MQVQLFHQRHGERERERERERQTDVRICVSIHIFYFGCRVCLYVCVCVYRWMDGTMGERMLWTGDWLDEKYETERDSQHCP